VRELYIILMLSSGRSRNRRVSLSARPVSSHTIRGRASSVWTTGRTDRGSSAWYEPQGLPDPTCSSCAACRVRSSRCSS